MEKSNSNTNADSERSPKNDNNVSSQKPEAANAAGANSNSRRNGFNPVAAPYNCTACYQRKTKCDRKLEGCSHCTKAGSPCTYPSQRNTAPQKRGPYNKDGGNARKNSELEKKMATLEATVGGLSEQLQERNAIAIHGVLPRSGSIDRYSRGMPPSESPNRGVLSRGSSGDNDLALGRRGGIMSRGSPAGNPGMDRGSIMSRGSPVGSATLPAISWTDFVTRFAAPGDAPDLQHDHYKYDLQAAAMDASSRSKLHPNSQIIREYWDIFKERVNPLLKILHIPTMEKYLFGGSRIPEESVVGMDALMFSIYYAAIINTPVNRTPPHRYAHESRESQLRKYELAIKRVVAETDMVTSSDLLPLQALIIYLYTTQTADDQTDYLLTGMALRMGQALGLHRNAAVLGKSPFDAEMRHRLWWNIYRLERRFSENYVSNIFAFEPQFDTPMPLNINDADIAPEDIHPPPPRIGRTEMTFCLIDFEVSLLTFAVMKQQRTRGSAPHAEKENMIRNALKNLTDEHLHYCNPVNDFDYMIISYTKLSLSRVWLLAHQPSRHTLERLLTEPAFDTTSSGDTPIRNLLPLALESYEYSQMLPEESRISPWYWFWGVPHNVHKHLEFYLLAEICYRPSDPIVAQAWNALDISASKIRQVRAEGVFETMLNRLWNRASELRYSTKPALPGNSMGAEIGMHNPLHPSNASVLGDLYPTSWLGDHKDFPYHHSVGSHSMAGMIDPQLLSNTGDFSSFVPPIPEDLLLPLDTNNLIPMDPDLSNLGSLGSGVGDASILSHTGFPSHDFPQKLNDAYVSKSPWFHLPPESMGGVGVEEFGGGRWDDMYKGLPSIEMPAWRNDLVV